MVGAATPLTKSQKQHIVRLFERGLDYCQISYRMGLTWQCVAGVVTKARTDREKSTKTNIRGLCTVKDPEAYLRAKRVDYRRCG